MKINVVGFQPVDFEKEGQKVIGTKVFYVMDDLSNEFIIGKRSAQAWIGQRVSAGINFDKCLEIQLCNAEFDDKGKLVALEQVKPQGGTI